MLINGYRTLKGYLKEKYGEMVYKIPIDGGFTCPNRDGTAGTGGCIFCSETGSGEFIRKPRSDISEQIKTGKRWAVENKKANKFIAYFQSFTNTYDSVENLRKKYYKAIEDEDIVAIAIATRPDCISDEIIELLKELALKKDVWVELGLQTFSDKTADIINRGYKTEVFYDALKRLRQNKIDVVVHLIFGLPYESIEDMKISIDRLCQLDIQGVKLHSLFIYRDSALYRLYKKSPWELLNVSEFTDLLVYTVVHLDKSVVIHRLTGDGDKKRLSELSWKTPKIEIFNLFREKIKLEGFQGCRRIK